MGEIVNNMPDVSGKDWYEIDIINKYHNYNRIANSDGFYQSVQDLKGLIDIQIYEYQPGTEYCFWEIPKRWYVNHATLKDKNGEIIADFKKNPLYLWAYSHPYEGKIATEELLNHHIFSNPAMPERIPFRFRQMFKHWEKNWGFSLPYDTVVKLTDPYYLVSIDTSFTDEPMVVFEYTAKGQSDECIILFGHWCHHGIVEDGLSGCSIGLKVIDELRKKNHFYTYKFVGVPEVIGTMAYLIDYPGQVSQIKAGLGLNFLGRDDYFVLFQSRQNRSQLDTAMEQALRCRGLDFKILSFKHADDSKFNPNDLKNSLYGRGCGDEAPFESIGFEIPTTTLIRRTPYKEYHTDQDNPALVHPDNLKLARMIILDAFEMIEQNWEPQGQFTGLPCLSSPKLDLFFSPPRDSNIPHQKEKGCFDDMLIKYNYRGNKINLHDLSTHLPYLLNSGSTVLDLADQFDVPFDFLNHYLQKWEDKKLVKWKRAKMEKRQ